jgi:vitamin B12 transporter
VACARDAHDTIVLAARGGAARSGVLIVFFLARALLILVPLVPTPAGADDAIETITVVAHRTPASLVRTAVPVDVVSRESIENGMGVDVADLLVARRGFAVARAGGIGQLAEVRLRGAEANHLQVRIDGVEINDPATGSSVDFSHLGIAGLERIEILRGAQSALWGSDALAGVLALETTPPAGTDRRTVAIESGAFDTHALGADLAGADESWHYVLAGRKLASDGTNVAAKGNEEDGYENTTLHLNAGHRSDAVSTRIVARDVRARSDYDPTPFPDFVPVDGDLHQRVRQQVLGIDSHIALATSLQHRVFGSLLESEIRNGGRDTATTSTSGRRTRFGYQAELAPGSGDTTLVLAGEYSRETFHQRGPASDFGDPNQNQSIDTTSAIAELRTRLYDLVETSLSARYDANDAFEDAASVRLAARAPLGARTTAWASVGTGTKNPTFTERFGYTPDTFYGNSSLEPERSLSYNVAIEHAVGAALTVGVAFFRDRLEDEIESFVFDPALGGFTARNRDGTSRRDGVEPWLRWQIADGVHVEAEYAWLDASESVGGRHDAEIRRPKNSASTRLVWRISDGTRTQLGLAWVGDRDDFDFAPFPARRVRLDDYTLLHWSARFAPGDRIGVVLRGDNLLDARHEDVYGYRTPGRAWSVSLEGYL